jgi:hypothetical protein
MGSEKEQTFTDCRRACGGCQKKNSKKKPAIRREKTHHQKKSFLSLLLIKIGI